MEQDNRGRGEPEQVSQLIADNIPKPERPRRPPRYEELLKIDPNHHLITDYQAALKIFDDYWAVKTVPRIQKVVYFKKLIDVDFLSLYHLFKIKYQEVTGVEFDYNHNNGESKKLVFTLLYYFFRDEKLLRSPLINPISEPSLSKGILVIGGYGCGKTSIFKALKKMFFDAELSKDVIVKDVDGDDVLLHRYRRKFGYFTANGVVEQFECTQTPEEKTRFWTIMNAGELYFDDLMTERKASNYGTVEIFKDILEKRDAANKRTLGSLNYDGSLDDTLKGMGKRYGPRVYDRIFGRFNIIELTGKSLRK